MDNAKKKYAQRKLVSNKLPLLELMEDSRIIIENHLGVVGYSLFEIQIKVDYGILCVLGDGLKFAQINKEQLVINGRIDTISVFRR